MNAHIKSRQIVDTWWKGVMIFFINCGSDLFFNGGKWTDGRYELAWCEEGGESFHESHKHPKCTWSVPWVQTTTVVYELSLTVRLSCHSISNQENKGRLNIIIIIICGGEREYLWQPTGMCCLPAKTTGDCETRGSLSTSARASYHVRAGYGYLLLQLPLRPFIYIYLFFLVKFERDYINAYHLLRINDRGILGRKSMTAFSSRLIYNMT